MVLRDWVLAALELIVGIFIRFYLWVIPLLLLQPIDLLDKLGIHIVIPDAAVYALVGLGVLASAADILRNKRETIATLERDADARRVVGTVHMNPGLYPAEEFRIEPEGPVVGITFAALVQLANHGDSTIVYRVQRFEALIEGVVQRLDHAATSFPIPKGEYMMVSGLGSFGPYPLTSAVDSVIVIEVRFSLPNSRSTVIEQRRLEFRSIVYHGTDGMGAKTDIFNPTPGPERYVAANINDDSADWHVESPFPQLEPTPGPHTGIFHYEKGTDPNDAVGLPPGTIKRRRRHRQKADPGEGLG
jgi:hypothetical protein